MAPAPHRLLSALLVLALPGASAQTTPVAPGRAARPRVFRVPADVPSIQGAIHQASSGDVILVAPGTYREQITFRGKAIEVVATEGPMRTTIHAQDFGPVVRFHHGEGPDSRLIGFTIVGGVGDFFALGGGVSCASTSGPVASPLLSDCVIASNFTDQEFQGLGAAGVHGDPILVRCVVRANQTRSPETAGGVEGAPWMIHCLVEDNAGCTGGGLKLTSGARIEDSILRGNTAGPCGNRYGPHAAGGGALAAGLGVVIERCLLVGNRVEEGSDPTDPGTCITLSAGGALAGQGPHLRACTIVGNRAVACAETGGIAGQATLVDCILRDNQHAPGEHAAETGFRYSDVEGGAAGTGSFDADPLFVDAGAGDWRLGAGSPCIDAGDPLAPADPDGTRGDVGALPHAQGTGPRAVAWHAQARLKPGDPQAAEFGRALALQGDTALIAAREAVHMFERSGSAWSERARLVPRAPIVDENFGSAVVLDGAWAAVAATQGTFFASPGAVYLFERDASGAFVETDRLSTGRDESFGAALALQGELLAVGATEGFVDMGRVVLFRRAPSGRWVELLELRSPHAPSGFPPEGGFGAALALAGDVLVVGEPWAGDQYDFNRTGAAYVYQRAGASPWSWVRVAELLPENRQSYGGFGLAVAAGNGRLLVAAHHGTVSYGANEPGLPWRRAEPVAAGAAAQAVLDGARAYVERPDGVHELHQPVPDGPWHAVGRVTPRRGPLAVSGGSALVGAPAEDGGAGAAYLLARGAEVDAVGLDQAADEDEVLLRGRGLDAITRVTVDGVEQPILRQSAGELAVRSLRRDPGRADLVLESALGALELPDAWRAAPTLAGTSGGPGTTLAFALENGAAGAYALHYSLDLLPAPVPRPSPPTWYGRLLDLQPGRSGRLWGDAFDASGLSQPVFAVPPDPALVGLTIHFQAWCRRGLFGTGRYAYSNAISVTF